jgi:hypothetical protein
LIRFVCDTPERIPARIYAWNLERAQGCPCCAFWRGVALGALVCACLSLSIAIAFL